MNTLTLLITKFLKKIELYAQEKPMRGFIIFIITILIGPPALNSIHKLILNFNYSQTFEQISLSYKNTFHPSDSIILILILFLILIILIIFKQMDEARKIRDNFSGVLRKWSTPINTSWNTRTTENGLGKMLEVSNSNLPGLLKGAFGWYDYELTFKAMMPSSTQTKNLGIFIRATDSMNGILLQINEKEFIPHYLFEGNYIIDDNQRMELQTNFPLDSWIDIKILVNGDDVEISFEGQKLYFKIKGYQFSFVPRDLLFKIESISTIKSKSKINNDLFSKYIEKLNEKNTIQNKPILDQGKLNKVNSEFNQLEAELNSQTSNSRLINLEYNNGSVGFRQNLREAGYYRSVTLKKIG